MFVQPGHDDAIPLQLTNQLPYAVTIYPGICVAQAVFLQTISPSATPYNQRSEKYPPHIGAEGRSRYYVDAAYEQLRTKLPPRRSVDWDGVANVAVIIGSLGAALSWVLGQMSPRLTAASPMAMIIFILATVVSVGVKVVRWLW
jgi:hypothetical protein